MNRKFVLMLKVIKRKYFRFDTLRWFVGGFDSPSPQWVKIRYLTSHMIPDGEWIETGTYLGDTTKELATRSKSVTTIEPSQNLYNFAKFRLRRKKNIRLRNGSSEELFHECLKQAGPKLNIWLDGHFSGDITFKGVTNTPVTSELDYITQELMRFKAVKVFIDDVRCFYHNLGDGNDYPKLGFLINWAEDNGFKWSIEQDIFTATFEAPAS